MMIGTPK